MAERVANERRIHDREWLRAHLGEERRRTELLGEIREALFGMQDGLTSTVAVVTTVGAATSNHFAVVVAGMASALAGVFSMAIGEYTGSKAQREIYDHEIEEEREEVRERRDEAVAEVAYMLEEEGLAPDVAARVADQLGTNENALLKTMVEKEHAISFEAGPGPLQGALIMGLAFGVGSLPPLIPYIVLPPGTALVPSVVLSGIAFFFVGAIKSRWTHRSPLRSGLEVLALGTFAAIAGYLFGSILPGLLGVTVPGV